jgi:hypothetical protein
MKTRIHSALKGKTTGRWIVNSILLKVRATRFLVKFMRMIKNEV